MKRVFLASAIVVSMAAGMSPAVAASAGTSPSVTGISIDPASGDSWPTGIGAGSEVIGGQSAGNATHGFVWANGKATDLGTLKGGDYSLATAIDDHGDIVGNSGNYDTGGPIHAVLWHDGVMKDLGSLGGNSFATAINSGGVIVGNSELQPSGSQFRAVMWQDGVMSVLPTLSGSYYDLPSLLNDQGEAAGYSVQTSGGQHAVLWSGGSIQDLGPGRAVALNSLGEVLVEGVDAQGHSDPFIWDDGTKVALPATVTAATGLNDSGQVVGTYTPAGSSQEHGFLWANGVMTDLGTLSPVGLNDDGQVLASSTITYGLVYVWDHGTITDLLPVSGTVAMPTAIGASGLVAGTSGLDTATVWQVP